MVRSGRLENFGGAAPVFEGRGVENFHFEPQYLENGSSDFREIFAGCGSL